MESETAAEPTSHTSFVCWWILLRLQKEAHVEEVLWSQMPLYMQIKAFLVGHLDWPRSEPLCGKVW